MFNLEISNPPQLPPTTQNYTLLLSTILNYPLLPLLPNTITYYPLPPYATPLVPYNPLPQFYYPLIPVPPVILLACLLLLYRPGPISSCVPMRL